ncbi:ABC transporter substrate-binding protein [Nocardiopsis sp. TSRI0078]|uniref:ABC transporter substrate-binding protein n=1 Tax=unclassified Nocardiopsis TaxID=2649073 RepID=UPI00093B077C|nr:ABC transporter substrate-binding protein [Nocardiopsis sp. TSRI0078]OKI18927.1 ABC transporter substrate-binding protein [Nocardiopsis sp. TSRI0078]
MNSHHRPSGLLRSPGLRRPRGAPLRRAAAAGTALLLAATPALASAPAAADEGGQDTLTVAISQQVDSFNPFTAQLAVTTNILRHVYDSLTTTNPETNEPAPALAESWETSEDGLTWTFRLRDDVTFSDGEPLTADDVAWTFTTMMENEAAAVANGNYVADFRLVTAPDDHTVVIELDEPQATMASLNVPIVPRHVWEPVLEEEGEAFAEYGNEDFPTVGSGPFVLSGHDRGRSITLEANPDHWRGAPGFDRIVMRYYSEKDAAVEALRSGEISFVYELTQAQATALESAEDIHVNFADGKRFQAFTINPGAVTQDGDEFGDGHPALADRTLRQAIVMAVDNEEIVDKAHGGRAVAAGGYIPPRYEDFHWAPEGGGADLGFDPDAANAMLDEAGYERGADGVRVSPDGDRLRLRMHVHQDRPANVNAGLILVERLADIGIEVQNLTVDPGVLSDALYAGEYDLIFTGWTVNPDPDYVLSIHTCGALPTEPGTMQGDAYFCDEEYDELYEAQLAEYDRPARAELVHRLQEVLYREAVVNVLAYPDIMEAYRTDQIASIQYEPAEGGNIWGQEGYWAWWSAEPASAEAGASASGPSTGVWVGVGAVVLVLVAAGGFLLFRRRSTMEDRE